MLVSYDGFPIGHDYKNQIIAYEAISAQIKQGDLYPRWLSQVNRGFGGANLFFYPPFAYYTAFTLDLLTGFYLDTKHVLILNICALLFLSSLSFYIFARRYASQYRSCIAAMLYMVLPYHLWFEVYERNAIAELASYIWIPLVFLYAHKDLMRHKFQPALLSISFMFLIITHLPTAVFCSLFFGLFSVLQTRTIQSRKDKLSYLLQFSGSMVIGAGLSCFYLFPAISLLDQTNSDYLWQGYYHYSRWFLWFETSCPTGASCTVLFYTALLQSIVPIAALIAILAYKNNRECDHHIWVFSIMTVLCLFMMTPFSSMLWQALWPLQKIQFPWRLLVLSDFFFATLFLFIISETSRKLHFGFGGMLLLLTLTLSVYVASYSIQSPHPPLHAFEESIEKKMLTREHIPSNENYSLTYKQLQQSQPQAFLNITKGRADIEILDKAARRIDLSIRAEDSFTLDIRQFYFKGWRVFVNNVDRTDQFNMRDGAPFGQIRVDMPRGDYSASFILTILPQERMGWLISFFSAVLFTLTVFLWPTRDKKKEP